MDVEATDISTLSLPAPFSYKGGSYPGTGGTCGTSIADDCTIVLSFTPEIDTEFSRSFSLQYNRF